MDISGLSVGMDVFISVIFGAFGALGVWYKLKNIVEIQKVEIISLQDDVKNVRENKKELSEIINKRVDSLKNTVEKNRERSDNNTNEIKGEMQKMELRIIQAIHEIKR
jgi:gas vesicle protein